MCLGPDLLLLCLLCPAVPSPGAEEGYDAYGYNPAGEAATGFATGFEPAAGFEAAPAPTGFEAAAAPAPLEYAAAPATDFGAAF